LAAVTIEAAEPARSAPSELAAELALGDRSRARALLIGVNDYERLKDLRFCENDVQALRARLIEIGFDRDAVKCLTAGDEDSANHPSYLNITERLEAMLAGLDESNVVLIALSGHGGSFTWQNETGKAEKASFFCPQDARLSDPAGTMISIPGLFKRLEKCPARFKLVVVDACRDPHFVLPGGRTAINEAKSVADFGKGFADGKLPRATIALVSCTSNEQSWEDEDLRHGIFMHYLLEALAGKADTQYRGNGNGRVSYLELKDFVYRQTSDHAFKKYDERQTPMFYANYWELSDFELLGLAEPNAPKMEASVCTSWPFDAREAARRQAETARSLGQPVQRGDSIGVQLSLVPAGEFVMGSPETEQGRHSDEREHRVRITRPFYLGCHEVTVDQFRTFVNEREYRSSAERGGGAFVIDGTSGEYLLQADAKWDHPRYSGVPVAPVVCVSASDAEAFCEWLTEKERVPYRLPTEAEWEYACRSGCAAPWSCGPEIEEIDRYANCRKGVTPERRTPISPVGSHKANDFGLFDMHGNVSEWCRDWYASGYYARSPADDPSGPDKGLFRVYRGGAWPDAVAGVRSAKRFSRPANQAAFDLSFRVVREIP
jgi:formylglycine-generating enzyme required for sulfatase activity